MLKFKETIIYRAANSIIKFSVINYKIVLIITMIRFIIKNIKLNNSIKKITNQVPFVNTFLLCLFIVFAFLD